jgi:predicted membrane-bound spermidine synthase
LDFEELKLSQRRIILHLGLWVGVFAFWLFFTRQHHPTLIVAAAATAVLVSSFALAVYVNSLFLQPRFAKRRLWLQYAAALLATIAILDLLAVLSIQLLYDFAGVPREGRYGFLFNMAFDGAGIFLHVAAAMFVFRVVKHLRRKRTVRQQMRS